MSSALTDLSVPDTDELKARAHELATVAAAKGTAWSAAAREAAAPVVADARGSLAGAAGQLADAYGSASKSAQKQAKAAQKQASKKLSRRKRKKLVQQQSAAFAKAAQDAAKKGRKAAGPAKDSALELLHKGSAAGQEWAQGTALPAITAAATHARDAVLESNAAHELASRASLAAAGAQGKKRRRWPLLVVGVGAGVAAGAAVASKRKRAKAVPGVPAAPFAPMTPPAGTGPATTRNVGGSAERPAGEVTELPPATTANPDGDLST